MTNKCDSCGEETAYDQWSSYSNDNAEKWCIDCGDDIHNEWVAECNANWQEMKQETHKFQTVFLNTHHTDTEKAWTEFRDKLNSLQNPYSI